MPAANKFNDYVNQKNRGTHNWATHAFKLAFTNTAPVAANAVLADLVQIAAGNGYVAGGVALTGMNVGTAAGVVTVSANQVVLTAAGGAVGPFRYYALYNDTSAADNLCLWWDHGAAITLNDGDSFTVKFNNASPGTIFTDS
jgi:hypothetical protein